MNMLSPRSWLDSITRGRERAGGRARRHWHGYDGGPTAAIESLETRLTLAATPVAGAWLGGAYDSIGVFENGLWQLDLDGDGFVGDDSPAFSFGLPGDYPLAGDWNGDGIHSVGVFRNGYFYLDANSDRIFTVGTDFIIQFGLPGDIPVAGNWDGIPGDEIGVFRNGVWSLDTNGSGRWDFGDIAVNFGLAGDIPVVGNWNEGTLRDSIGIYRNGVWSIDFNEDFVWSGVVVDRAFSFGSSIDRPFVGDFSGNNRDEVGIISFANSPPRLFFRAVT